MGCCGKNEVAPEQEAYGPKGRRKCRDVLFLFMFIGYWVGMIVVAFRAVSQGEPSRMVYGVDMWGNTCGVNNKLNPAIPTSLSMDLTNKKYLYWAYPLDLSIQLCVEECPSELSKVPLDIITQFSFDRENLTELYNLDITELVCDYDTEPSILKVPDSCWPIIYKSKPILNRCMPSTVINGTQNFVKNDLNAQEISTSVIADFLKAWPWILAAVGVSIILGFGWLLLMRLFAGLIVWVTIFAVYAILGGITAFIVYSGYLAREKLAATPEDEILSTQRRNEKALTITGYILIAICVILLLLLLWMRKRIQLAIGIMKEATKAIKSMPSIIFFPAFIYISLALFQAYWVGISFYLSSSGTYNYNAAGTAFGGFEHSKILRGMQIYHFFGFLWTNNFIIAIGQTTIAGAISAWYWVRDEDDVPTFPVLFSFLRTIRYHLGSLAFGSLIIAIVQFIRACIKWIQKRLKGASNPVVTWLLRILDCCFLCFERFLKFINKNAYIMIAVKGDSFCKSAQRAFTLLLSNILRVGTVGVISNFLLFLGKLFVTGGACLFGGLLLRADESLTFWYIPLLVIAILSYFVGSCFMSVYDMAIDTILLSFCEDCERNDGSPERPYYMRESLQKFLDHPITKKFCCC